MSPRLSEIRRNGYRSGHLRYAELLAFLVSAPGSNELIRKASLSRQGRGYCSFSSTKRSRTATTTRTTHSKKILDFLGYAPSHAQRRILASSCQNFKLFVEFLAPQCRISRCQQSSLDSLSRRRSLLRKLNLFIEYLVPFAYNVSNNELM
jgi:hypothetical protein